MTRQSPLAVHIERVVLDEAVVVGRKWDARARQALQAALQAALQEQLAASLAPSLADGCALVHLPAGELRVASGSDAATLGRGLGTQIAGALKTEPLR